MFLEYVWRHKKKAVNQVYKFVCTKKNFRNKKHGNRDYSEILNIQQGLVQANQSTRINFFFWGGGKVTKKGL